MTISKFYPKAIAFSVAFISISVAQAMELSFQRDVYYEWNAEDEIGIKVDEKANTKKLIFTEQRGNIKTTREIAWDLPHSSSKIGFSELEFFNPEGIKTELDALTFNDITINYLRAKDSSISGPGSQDLKILFFEVPISNGLSFFFMSFDTGFCLIYKHDLKKFKSKATKYKVKSLTFPIFCQNHWNQSHGTDLKTRKKVLSHLTYPSSAKIPSSIMVDEPEKLKEIEEIVLSKPFTVAIVGTLYGKSHLIDQLIFSTAKKKCA